MTFFPRHPGQKDHRGRSRELWDTCNRPDIRDDFAQGYYFDDDFMVGKAEGTATDSQLWEVSSLTSGSFDIDSTATDAYGGIRILDTGASTDNQGVGSAQVDQATFIPTADTTIWFETRLQVDGLTGSFFFGLSEVDTTLLSATANTSANHIGFESLGGDSVILLQGEKAGARNTALATPATLVAATYIKLGFKVTGVTRVQFYIDGVEKPATELAVANIPIVTLVPSLSLVNTGSTQVKAKVDWVSCFAQRRN